MRNAGEKIERRRRGDSGLARARQKAPPRRGALEDAVLLPGAAAAPIRGALGSHAAVGAFAPPGPPSPAAGGQEGRGDRVRARHPQGSGSIPGEEGVAAARRAPAVPGSSHLEVLLEHCSQPAGVLQRRVGRATTSWHERVQPAARQRTEAMCAASLRRCRCGTRFDGCWVHRVANGLNNSHPGPVNIFPKAQQPIPSSRYTG